MKTASEAADQAAENDSGAAGTVAVPAAVIDGKLRDLEVLSIGSDPVDKISEAAGKEKAADTAAEMAVCPLVAAMLAVETAKAADADKEKAAAVATKDGGNSSSNNRGSEVAEGAEDPDERFTSNEEGQ